MIPVQFDYKAPQNVADAVKLLQTNEGSLILAGSHSLMAAMKQGNVSPSLLIDIKNISGLDSISGDASGFRVGGMTPYDRVASATQIKDTYLALAEVALSVGDAQIRNWQRIGDLSAYRDLAAGLLAVALILNATFEIVDVKGSRTISTEELIKLAVEEGWLPRQIVRAIAFPVVLGTGTSYQFLKNPASHYPICAVAAFIEPSADGVTVAQCRVAVAGALSYAIRLPKVEDVIKGKGISEENITAAAKVASEDIIAAQEANKELTVVSDLYASADYRTHLIGVLTKRALTQAIKQARFSA